MSKRVLVVFLVLCLLLTSCAPGVTADDCDTLKVELESKVTKIQQASAYVEVVDTILEFLSAEMLSSFSSGDYDVDAILDFLDDLATAVKPIGDSTLDFHLSLMQAQDPTQAYYAYYSMVYYCIGKIKGLLR